jgi:hypothetical protein
MPSGAKWLGVAKKAEAQANEASGSSGLTRHGEKLNGIS